MIRSHQRTPAQVRPVRIIRQYIKHAAGSALIECGDTKVICTASVVEQVPPFLKGQGQGWLTAEYGMLPGSTHTRMQREASKGKQSGRTMEIQRLIGRALRAVTDLKALGERQITLDCDVLQADGGTRCASITGAWIALYEACEKLVQAGKLPANPVRDHVAAISVGIFEGSPVLDLDYPEDSNCDTDMNVIMTGKGGIVEVQGTAEGEPFSREQMNVLMDLAEMGIRQLVAAQESALAS